MCLSYVWGSPNDVPIVIEVNRRPFKIQPNLNDFLIVAKEKYPGRAFWIDAICIDQSNNSERIHQVQQMGQIYSKAGDVISWLGKNVVISEFAVKAREGFRDGPMGLGLVRNPYWTRAWITQEILLAQDVLFLAATEEMRLRHLQELFSWIDYGQTELAQLRPLLSLQPQNIRGTNLFRLLALFRNKGCSIKRDRIFSLLSLCEQNLNWKIDYDVSDAELYKRIIRETSNNMVCLCSCWLLSNILDTQIFLHEPSFGKTFEERLYSGNIVATMFLFPHTTNMLRCTTCQADLAERGPIPVPTYIFCLTQICEKLRGHLYSDGQNQYLWYASEHESGLDGISGENFRVNWGSSKTGAPVNLQLNYMGLAQLIEALRVNDTHGGAWAFNLCDKVWNGEATERFTVSKTIIK